MSILCRVRLARLLACCGTAALSAVAGLARAEGTASARFHLDPVQPATAHSPFFITEGPVRSLAEGGDRFALTLLTTYARSPLTVHLERDGSTDELGAPVENAVMAHVVAGVLVGSGLAVDASLPVAVMQSGRDVVLGAERIHAPNGASLGDARLGAAWRGWFSPSLGYVVGTKVWAPTGDQDAWSGNGRFRADVLAGSYARSAHMRAGCTLQASPTFVSPRAGDRIGLACAGEGLLLSGGPWLGGEAAANALRIDPDVATGSEFEVWATVHQPAGPFRMGVGVGPGFGSSPGTPVFRALATFAYAPEPLAAATRPAAGPARDPDLDGVLGAADACPDEAGPPAADASRNGCPRSDRDGDGVEDSSDACPEEMGGASRDAASNGCPDADNDHVADKLDRCPAEPGKASEKPAESGCPQRARLQANRFVISPPLSAGSPQPNPQADDDALWEVAFTLRAWPRIRKVAVEVKVQAADDDLEAAERAIETANDIVKRLIDMGVDGSRLDPVGAIADSPGIEIRIVETASDSSPPSR